MKYRALKDSEILKPLDVIVKAGVYFDSSTEAIKTLKAILANGDELYLDSFQNAETDFLVCHPEGYGNGEYRVANVKKLVGESYFGTALRLLDNENPSNVSSYSTPLPLP